MQVDLSTGVLRRRVDRTVIVVACHFLTYIFTHNFRVEKGLTV